MTARIAVVTADDRFVRWTDREQVHAGRLLHRSVHVVIHDRAGRLVLQRRHPGKLTNPDLWDISVSGHVEEEDYPAGPDERLDEVYARVARRETREELGIDADLRLVAYPLPLEPSVHYELIALFRGVHDGPYVAQPEEVTEVRAVDAAGLARLLASENVTPGLRWFARKGWLFLDGRPTI
jgi:isopentenyldiphosphate isomerase